MNYNLNNQTGQEKKTSNYSALRSLLKLIANERNTILIGMVVTLANSALTLSGPVLVALAIDKYIVHKDYPGLLSISLIILLTGMAALAFSYYGTKLMGGVGQRTLFTLRNAIFNKLQQLPVAFFNANKAGDLISRVNNDTDKLNAFFSQSLVQFIGNIATMIGAAVFLLIINLKLGLAVLVPGLAIMLFTRVVSDWVKRKNAINMKTVGGLSAEIQESLDNFRVIIAFNRRDYFRKRFDAANQNNYKTALGAGIANNVFLPVYSLFSSLAQLIILVYGIYLIAAGEFSVGLLISYLLYATYFYNPLRQLAALWASFQVAMAGWDRVAQILSMDSNLTISGDTIKSDTGALIGIKNVHFGYEEGKEILHNVNLELSAGRTYAFVGPTGGGKTTTVSLMARLYDPTSGSVFLNGRDLRSYTPAERTAKIGFILQEPFLFTGTVKENILYGNEMYQRYTAAQLEQELRDRKLDSLITIFEEGLETKISTGGNSISLGQKQLIAFIRAVLRSPDILILDEATANIDTVTEQLLQEILNKLPATTTRIIIAHRLNTIENADEIFFVNSGEVIQAGSFDNALDLLMKGRRAS